MLFFFLTGSSDLQKCQGTNGSSQESACRNNVLLDRGRGGVSTCEEGIPCVRGQFSFIINLII
jgi:hypothetical protein